ncbi:hypothetical protein [Cupriavidus basilensis]|uniref:hypothetical protein n=1 Tax=Cupriavidus basilensis TaxID=68895 RepID=UPI0020A6D1B1|nr:hypothetical protein [Cupriavidus basilensis]MCP3022772.1 hypothetical protein [Cupriavidus basilensis]
MTDISIHKAHRISVSWVHFQDGRRFPTFRGPNLTLLETPTDYCATVISRKSSACASEAACRTAIDNAVTAVREVHTFLSEKKIRLAELRDKHIEMFRDWAWERTMQRPQYRGDSTVAMDTTNIRVKEVYRYLVWAQENQLIPAGTIGPVGCGITSTLPVWKDSKISSDTKEEKLFPELFRRTGHGSRLGRRQYRATDDDLAAMETAFQIRCNQAVLQRNMLMMRIAYFTTWRCSSINSLETRQFTRERLQNAEARKSVSFDVAPPIQKYGYQNIFSMPWSLAYEIARYIENDREEIIGRTKVPREMTKGRIFLSDTTGRPLSTTYVSTMFSKGLRDIGAPKGAGLQGVRRSSATRIAQEEIEFRKREGLSMQREDVVDAIAATLGQRSKTAYRFYVDAEELSRSYTVESQLEDELTASQSLIAALRAEVALLREKLGGC